MAAQMSPATTAKRVGAWFIDWFISGIVCGLPAVITYSIVNGKGAMFPDLYVFEAMGKGPYYAIVLGFTCLILGFIYYVIVPWKILPGQTLGKKWLHLQIRKIDGSNPTFTNYLLRQFVMLFFVEGIATSMGNYITPLITTISRFYLDSYIKIFWTLATFLSFMFLVGGKSHLALHDHVANTQVVSLEDKKTN